MDHKMECTISDLPVEVWRIVTSYLGVIALGSLFKACNKIMRRNLRSNGGVTSLEVQRRAELYWSDFYRHLCPPFRPILPDFDVTEYRLSKFPPVGFFPRLTSLVIASECSDAFYEQVHLEILPRTLTHLGWCATNRELLPKWTKKGEEAPTLAVWFPNLVSLDLGNIWATETLDGFAANLPRGLTALRVVTTIARVLIDQIKELPQNLVFLSLCSETHSIKVPMAMKESELKDLPSSVTNLTLMDCIWDLNLELPCQLTLLAVYQVPLPYRKHLPMTITSLSLARDDTTYSEQLEVETGFESLKRLKSLCVFVASSPLVPWIPQLQHLHWPVSMLMMDPHSYRNFGILAPADPFKIWRTRLGLPSFETLTSQVGISGNHLQLYGDKKDVKDRHRLKLTIQPTIYAPEHALALIPCITELEVSKILLDGSSLPDDITHLDSREDLIEHFRRASRPFNISIPDSGLLLRSVPRPAACFLRLPLQKIISLTIERHDVLDLTTLPSASLTRLSGIFLSNADLDVLPPKITSLHFQQNVSETPINVVKLRQRLAGLVELSSSTPTSTRYKIGELLAPVPEQVHGLESIYAGPLARVDKNTIAARGPITLTLPDDVSASFYSYSCAGIQITDVEVSWSMVLSETARISATEVSLVGSYYITPALMENGFSYGLTCLDMARAMFLPIEGKREQLLPPLPKTLTFLCLGFELAEGVLLSTPLDPSARLPSALKTLELFLPRAPQADWNISKSLSSKLLTLRITHPVGSGEIREAGQLQKLNSRFGSYEVSTNGDYVNVLAGSSSTSCSVM